MENKYRVFCKTEGIWVYTDWINSEPTICPNSAGHTIDPDSIAVVSSISDRDILLSIGGNSGEYYYECDSSYWEVIRKFQFRGTHTLGEVKSCSIIAEVHAAAYPGEFRLYDFTNDKFITSWTVTTETFETHVDLTPIDLPEESAMFEIQGKSSGDYESGNHTKISTFFMEFL